MTSQLPAYLQMHDSYSKSRDHLENPQSKPDVTSELSTGTYYICFSQASRPTGLSLLLCLIIYIVILMCVWPVDEEDAGETDPLEPLADLPAVPSMDQSVPDQEKRMSISTWWREWVL